LLQATRLRGGAALRERERVDPARADASGGGATSDRHTAERSRPTREALRFADEQTRPPHHPPQQVGQEALCGPDERRPVQGYPDLQARPWRRRAAFIRGGARGATEAPSRRQTLRAHLRGPDRQQRTAESDLRVARGAREGSPLDERRRVLVPGAPSSTLRCAARDEALACRGSF